MAEVLVELNAPDIDDPSSWLDYRQKAEARAQELGWPAAHSQGMCFAYERPVVDLQFTVHCGVDGMAQVITTWRREFNVQDVLVFNARELEDEEDDRP